MNRIARVACVVAIALVGCRDNGGGGDDQPTPDAPVGGGEVTIQEVQNDMMAVGTPVTVKGVVVTAIDTFGNRTGDFFVQEPGGGEFSGVKVFGAPLDQLALLAPGDLVDISGAEKDEFALTSDMSGLKVTELKAVTGGAMTVTKVGTGTLPTPAAVDAKAIAALPTRAERDAEWEKWEGVLIKLTNARQLGSVSTFGSTPGPDSTEFRATSFVRVQSALVELPSTAAAGDCWDSITGVGDYFFNWILAPRTAADFVGGGAACNPMAETIVALQSATTTPEMAKLTGVYVTGRDDLGNNKGFWVSDALQGAANNGVYVFTGTTAADAGLVIGAKVDVVGGIDEFDLGTPPVGDSVTEVVNAALSNIVAPAGAPTPATTATVTTLADITATGEPWEGVLVQVGPVKVTNNNAGAGKVELTDNNGATILADDESFAFSPQGSPVAVNTCYATFTGLMHVQVTDNVRTINPRAAGDLVVGGGCN